MTNLTEKFKAQLEKFTPVTLIFLKKESPDYIKGFESFKRIVTTNYLGKIEEEEEEEMNQQRKILKIKERLHSAQEFFGCQSVNGEKLNVKTIGLNLEEMKKLMPFTSLVLKKETTESSFGFLNNPSLDDSEIVTLVINTFTPPYTKLQVSHWEIDLNEIPGMLDTNTKDITEKMANTLVQGELTLDDRFVRELFAKHNLTFENIYRILNDVVENNISLNEKNTKMITSILENFCSAISNRVTEICAQMESYNAVKKETDKNIKEKENEMKQKEFEKILKVESSLQCNYLINK